MPYVKINGEQIRYVRLVETVNGGRTFVRCVTDDEKAATKFYDFLTELVNTNGKLEFELLNIKGQRVRFEGKILLATKKPNSLGVHFTAEPTGPVRIK